MDEGVQAAEVSGDKGDLSAAVPLMASISADLQRIVVHKAAPPTTAWPPTAACIARFPQLQARITAIKPQEAANSGRVRRVILAWKRMLRLYCTLPNKHTLVHPVGVLASQPSLPALYMPV